MCDQCRKYYDIISKRTVLAQTMEDMHILYTLLITSNYFAGDVAEVGVFHGGTAFLIASIVRERKNIHLFDTFQGMPNSSPDDYYLDGTEHKNYKIGDLLGTLENVHNTLVDFPHIKYHKGIFPESVTQEVKDSKFSFVHIDTDIYSSTIESLKFFYPRLVEYGVMLIHDYTTCNGVKRAVDEFKEAKFYFIGNQAYCIYQKEIENKQWKLKYPI